MFDRTFAFSAHELAINLFDCFILFIIRPIHISSKFHERTNPGIVTSIYHLAFTRSRTMHSATAHTV